MTTTTPAIRLTSPSDVLSAVPHLLGYEVTRSLVLICLSGSAGDDGDRATFAMAARMDLPAPDEAAAVEALLPAVARVDPDAALVIAYADSLTDATVAVEVLSATLTEVGIKVLHRLAVVGGQWTSIDHPAHPEGRWAPMPGPEARPALEFAVAVGSSPAAFRAALVGRCAAGPRAAFVGRECDRLADVDDELGGAVTYRATDEVTIGAGAAAWSRLLLGRPGPAAAPDATVALAALSLHVGGVRLRDALAEWLAPGMLPWQALDEAAVAALSEHLPLPWHPGTEPAQAADSSVPVFECSGWVEFKVQLVDRLVEVAGCLPDGHAAPVLALLAHVAYMQGNGALARIAVERALTADPDYRWAVLIGDALDAGLRPPA